MKNIIFATLFFSMLSHGQVGINTTNPDLSSMLDITASDKGFLLPRIALLSTTDVTTVASPAQSLMVFNTATVNDVSPGFYYWSGSVWERLVPSSEAPKAKGLERVNTSDGTFVDIGAQRIWTSGSGSAPTISSRTVLAPFGSTTSYITLNPSASGTTSDTFTCSRNITNLRGYVAIQTSGGGSTSRWRVFLYINGILTSNFWGAPPNGVNNQRTQCVFEYGPIPAGSTIEIRIDENTLPASLQNQASYFMVEYEL